MRTRLIILLALITACTPKTSVIWIEGERQEDRHAVHELLVCNPPKGLDWDIWGVFDRSWTMPVKVLEGSDATLERYDGVCLRISPLCEKDTLRIRYDNRYLNKHSRAPRGFTLKKRHGGKSIPLPLVYEFLPCDPQQRDSFQWIEPALADMVPQLKSVSIASTGNNSCTEPAITYVDGKVSGWYRINCSGGIQIEAADKAGLDYALITLDRLFSRSDTLPDFTIEDWPDFPVRAFMLDVARNYMPLEQVFTIIDLLHRYKMNTLLIHLTEDEGWRLEIDGLPELTEFGAFHAIPVYQEDGSFRMEEGLFPSQDGKVGKDKPWGSGNGYYSRDEFKQILRYAAERDISVIPELDFPGHSGAAIESMAFRAWAHGDDSYLLTDPADTSKYMAYQGFEHNVVDVALPSTYRFIGKVVDEIVRLYDEADVPLEIVNISGDEVANGCWLDSPSCRALMEEKGWSSTEELWSYFLDRIIDLLAERNLKFAGYAEVVAGTSGEVLEKMREHCGFIIVWRPLTEKMGAETAYRLAGEGFKVLLSNGDYTYMDNAYNYHKTEWGLTWAGPTDERKAFSYDPLHLLPGEYDLSNIIGVEPMLWGDNIYDFDTACYLLFPKSFGMFERCWNAVPDDDFDRFYSIVTDRELPYLESIGIKHREPMQKQQ